jgi:Predicted hydrolases or acyltransferases (alpha/beta hydrolase superfamily)
MNLRLVCAGFYETYSHLQRWSGLKSNKSEFHDDCSSLSPTCLLQPLSSFSNQQMVPSYTQMQWGILQTLASCSFTVSRWVARFSMVCLPTRDSRKSSTSYVFSPYFWEALLIIDISTKVRYDMRGHGRSGKPNTPKDHSSSLYADDFSTVAKAFSLVKPVFVGWWVKVNLCGGMRFYVCFCAFQESCMYVSPHGSCQLQSNRAMASQLPSSATYARTYPLSQSREPLPCRERRPWLAP